MSEETKETTKQEVDYKAEYERVKAELESKSNEYTKLKTNFDKTSSEVADYKRKERERMSEDDKRQAELAEREAYYKELERKNALRDYADELDDVADSKEKEEISKLFADGNVKGALQRFKQWRIKDRSEIEKRVKSELMKQNPQPQPQNGSTSAKTKEEIMAIKDTALRQAEIAKNINLFT